MTTLRFRQSIVASTWNLIRVLPLSSLRCQVWPNGGKGNSGRNSRERTDTGARIFFFDNRSFHLFEKQGWSSLKLKCSQAQPGFLTPRRRCDEICEVIAACRRFC